MYKFHDHHKTKRGKQANHVQCDHFFAGKGQYKGHIFRVSADVMEILKSLKYKKGRTTSHEDRWFSFTTRIDKALEQVPKAQRQNVRFLEAHARYLRNALKPKTLPDHVDKVYSTEVHPDTKL